MADRRSHTEKKSLSDRIANFIEKQRILLLGIIIAAVVIIVGMAIFTSIKQKNTETAIIKSEKMQEYYSDYSSATDDSAKKDIRSKIVSAYDELTKKYSKTYGAQRAYFIMANVYWEETDWANCAQTFRTLGEDFPKGYLAPVALLNSAAAYEEAGDTDQALAMYMKVIESFSSDPSAPKAYFSAARVNEVKGNNEEALRLYKEILQEYQTSNWTKFARSRIIQLELDIQ